MPSYQRPYAINSPWNSRPDVSSIEWGSFVIPKSSYYPAVQGGAYSTGVFSVSANPPYPAMLVHAYPGKTINCTTPYQQLQSITIPHWPPNLVAATGADGAADIVDEQNNVIHSFYQLKKIAGLWYCTQYSKCALDGMGWPTLSDPTQGSRAIGVPASAGLIRAHEISDGTDCYRHALCVSLTYSALSKASVIPRAGLFTAHDSDVSRNYGQIPYGALMMLSPNFPQIQGNLDLRKVVVTLKTYGAYVVDRNDGTSFNIYVENGANFNLHKNSPNGWDNVVANWLDQMRAAMRQVVSAKSWLDANGAPIV